MNTILEELGENAEETQQLQVAQMYYTALIENRRSIFIQVQLLIHYPKQPELISLFFKLLDVRMSPVTGRPTFKLHLMR